MIRFTCTSCRVELHASEHDAGTIGFCSQCKTPYVVPRDQQDPAVKLEALPPRSPQKSMLWIALLIGGVLLVLFAVVVKSQIEAARARASTPPPEMTPAPPPKPQELAVFDPPPALSSDAPILLDPKVISTAPIPSRPQLVDDTLYVGDELGIIYAIDTHTLKVEQRKLGQRFHGFRRRGSKLEAEIDYSDHFQLIAEFPHSIEVVDPANIRPKGPFRLLGNNPVPKTVEDGDQIVSFEGKYYACNRDGKVTVIDRGVFTYFKSPLEKMGLWKISLLPNGPAGFDNTAVFALDENLCPTRRIINLNQLGRSRAYVMGALAGDGTTMCFVTDVDGQTRMQIWSLDGSYKLREIPVHLQSFPPSGRIEWLQHPTLAVLGQGYLFVGSDITWLSVGAQPPLQFPTRPGRQRNAGRVDNFMPPIIADGKIFVAHPNCNVYVFEISSLGAAPRTASTSDQGNP